MRIDEQAPAERAAVPSRAATVVLGGGPAGLSAAWELARSGAEVLVLEKEDAPGGLCRTHRRDGFAFDLGGHRFITRDRELFDAVAAALGERLRVAERSSVVRIGDREYSYPLRIGEVLRGEGVHGVARVLGSWVASRLRRPRGSPATFEQWAKAQFGTVLYARFFAGYTAKLWGVPAAELSSDWAGERIPQLSLAAVALRAVGLDGKSRRTFARRYCYPRRGIGEIFEAVADDVVRRGGRIVTGARAVALRAGPPHVVVAEKDGALHEITCERILSTLPLPEFAGIAGADETVLASAGKLRFRGLRCLNLELTGPPISARTWIYVPDPRLVMTRVQIPAQRSAENCPAGRTSVQLEIACDPGDPLWSLEHEALLGRGLADLAALGFDVRERLLGSFDVRAEHAYPRYDVGYREHRDRLLAWIDSLPGVDTCGRQGRFRYIFFDRAMREGIDAARRALGKPTAAADDENDAPLIPEEARSLIDDLPERSPGVSARR